MRDYPRMRGNNYAVLNVMLTFLGSPPRMREQLMPKSRAQAACGITPADAGITYQDTLWPFKPPDHPRTRGNNAGTVSVSVDCSGSPPQVRE